MPLAIEGDQPVGPGDDLAGGTIVVLQANDLGVGPVALEVQDVRDLRAPPAIDRLVVVAHDAQVAMCGSQGLDDAILAAVGVLVLVDQEMIEAFGLRVADFGEAGEKFLGQQQQVVEIDGAGRLQGLLIAAIGRGGQMFLVGLGDGDRLARAGWSCSSSGRSDRANRPA